MLGGDPAELWDLYLRKFEIAPSDRIATLGCCLSQHMTRALPAAGFDVMDVEPSPPWLDRATCRAHGYGLFSARTGAVSTARHLLQLARETFEGFEPSEVAWTRKGRWYDALRPGVDPNGLTSPEEASALRRDHIAHLGGLFETADVLFVTLGSTEIWLDMAGTTVFPTAPGTVAGEWDDARYRFSNADAASVTSDLHAFWSILKAHNPEIRMILSVSPAFLSATGGEDHVLAAAMRNGAVLRTAADALAFHSPDVDYFPAWEIVAAPFQRGTFYGADLRTVTDAGYQALATVFLDQHGRVSPEPKQPIPANDTVLEVTAQ